MTMVSEDRQRVIETNKSLRIIKNELESLLEKGIIDDEAFDSISAQLPAELSIGAASRRTTAALRTPSPTPPTTALNLSPNNSNNNNNEPPSYSQSTSNGPPPLPGRNQPPPAQQAKPIIAHARALYRYVATDARDCSLERDDRVAVHEYMNADWWMGRNLRTGQDGIFPKSYVKVETAAPPTPSPGSAGGWNEKAAAGGGYPGAGGGGYQPLAQPPYGGGAQGAYPPPGGGVNPYNAQAPPMAIAEQGGDGGSNKAAGTGKKLGKKLGNAAIFGAGATIGSNIVNSIF